jgi:hypothetical protein
MQNFDHNIGFWEKRQFFAENFDHIIDPWLNIARQRDKKDEKTSNGGQKGTRLLS